MYYFMCYDTHPGALLEDGRSDIFIHMNVFSVVKCLWEVFVWGSCRARVCAGVGGVFSVGVSCVRVTC